MKTNRWRMLDPHDRALVAVAVLVDGSDSSVYLACDDEKAAELTSAAKELCSLEVDARLMLVGTALRIALEEAE